MPENNQSLHIGKDEFTKVDVHKVVTLSDGNESIIDKINNYVIDHSSVSIKERVTFFRLLATMINAGLSITKGLGILDDQEKNPRLKRICQTLKKTVEMGQTLSEGMKQFPDVFEDSQVGMLHSGEVSGKLNQTLLTVADQMEASAKIKGKIKGAMMYPIAIISVVLIVVAAVTILVIPKLKSMFEQGGAELPAATQALINLSDFLLGTPFFGIPNAVVVVVAAIIGFVLLGKWKKTQNGKFYWDHFVFAMPVFGNLSRKVVLARFCRGISTLLKSGISITKALVVTSEIVGSEVYRRRIVLIADDVSQGITIAENIKDQEKMWPIMLVSMIGVGEQTAQLDGVSSKLAEFYEEEVDNVVKNLSSLMEPIIILVIGGVVGFLVAAIMSPIMKMSEVATG